MTCKNCGYENKLGVRYCQRCGQYIEPKRTLAQEVKSWDFRSLAGVGRRDVNIAPLFTASPVQTPAKAHQTPSPVEPMPDGRWYCPDCGTLNASSERFAKTVEKSDKCEEKHGRRKPYEKEGYNSSLPCAGIYIDWLWK